MFEHLPEWVHIAGEWMEAAMQGMEADHDKGCRMTDLFTDAIALLKEKHRCSDCAH